MTKISIIVPVYNVEKYISRCLDSLVNQTLNDIEIIVVNDGSIDNSQKVIDGYAKKYKNVKSYTKENGGQGSARNFGLTKSSGEYVGYVDSDDYVELDMYEKLYNKAKENDSDIVICDNYNVYEKKEKNLDIERIFFDDNKINAFFGKKAVWNKIYKKNLLLKNKLKFRSKVWYEDLDFTIKAIISAKNIDYVRQPLYNYLIREGSTMNNSNVKRNLEILDAFDEILKYKNYKNYNDIIEFLAIDHIYISAIVRIIKANANKKLKNDTINELLSYMNNNFPNFKDNKYINTLTRNRKIIYNLINLRMYNIIKLIFNIKKG